jgi:hypothetical protein
MRTHIAAALAALVGLCLCAGAVNASIQVVVGDQITLNRPAGTFGTSGGEFKVDVLGKGVAPPQYDFSTFCVQLNEFISFGTTYNVFDISKKTVAFDVDLGSFAAWLYTKFLAGSISLLNHQDANAVQIGIWRSMGYLPGGDGTSSIGGNYDALLLGNRVAPAVGTLTWQYYNDLAWTGAAAIDANGNKGTNTGDIWIMNLKALNGANVQDQMVQVPSMPEPMSLVVWSFLAMSVLGLSRRAV